MDTHRTIRRRRRQEEAEEAELAQQQKLKRKRLLMYGIPAGVVLVGAVAWLLFGGGPTQVEIVYPQEKVKLDRLYAAYKSFCDRNRKAPANEAALKDYLTKLPQPDKDALKVSDAVDEVFVNPRDSQKYEVRWGVMADPAASRSLMWEKTAGDDGKRWFCMANGYCNQIYPEEFTDLTKR
jgi:hypothetical protein